MCPGVSPPKWMPALLDRGMCVAKARKLIQLYEKNGIGPERILIKLAATGRAFALPKSWSRAV